MFYCMFYFTCDRSFRPKKVKKLKEHIALHDTNTIMELRHLPYGSIQQCYLPPDTSDAPRFNPSWYSIYLPWRDGRLS